MPDNTVNIVNEQETGGNNQIHTPVVHEMPTTTIQPFDIMKSNVITNFRVNITRVELFKSVDVSVQLFAENGVIADVRNIKLEGDDYAQWTNDDQSLINMVATKLGFTVNA